MNNDDTGSSSLSTSQWAQIIQPQLNAQDISQHTTTNNELNDLFPSKYFLNFISTILQTRLYPSTDPYGKYYANIFHVGDGLNWHFDRSEYSISLILQPAQEGGKVQFVPNTRDIVKGWDTTDDLVKKPLAKCTATQLGHYFGLLWSKREGTTTLERTPWADLTIEQLKPELRKRGLKFKLPLKEPAATILCKAACGPYWVYLVCVAKSQISVDISLIPWGRVLNGLLLNGTMKGGLMSLFSIENWVVFDLAANEWARDINAI